MAVIRFDPDLMQALINNLTSYAEDANGERGNIHQVSENNSHPVSSVEEATCAQPSLSRIQAIAKDLGFRDFSTVSGTIEYLMDLVEDMKTRRQNILDINSDGIITATPDDGVISYYLPDGTKDTIDNIRTSNTQAATDAKNDATALSQALSTGGTADDGRTVEQILDNMAKYQDLPVYSNIFVNTYGVEKFIELPISMYWHYTKLVGNRTTQYGDYSVDRDAVNRANSTLGHILGSATQASEAPEGFGSWADAFYTTVTADGHHGRISALNALLAAPGALYGTRPLVDLATKMENLDKSKGGYYDGNPASSTPDLIWGYFDDAGFGCNYNEGQALARSSMDPMYGVIAAMGNNPDAALAYLVPDGSVNPKSGLWVPGATTNERWAFLKSRKWEPEGGLNAFTAAQAAASSLRSSDSSDQASAATWATARSIEYAVNDLSTSQYTETMKENFSVLVANSANEIEYVAQGGSPDGLGLNGDEATDRNTVSSLIYRIMDNKNAAATVFSALTQASFRDYEEISSADDLKSKYQRVGTVYGYLNELASQRIQDINDDKKADAQTKINKKNAISTGMSVLTTVAGAGISGPTATLIWNVGTTIVKPIIVDQLAPNTVSTSGGTYPDGRTSLQSRAYAEAVNNHVIDSPGALDPSYLQDENGKPYDWYSNSGGTPTFNLSQTPTDNESVQVHNWAQKIRESGNDPRNVLNDVNTAINTGISDGTAQFKGQSGSSGSSVPPIKLSK